MRKEYTVRTRNWFGRPEVAEKLEYSTKWGVLVCSVDPTDPYAAKYILETGSRLLAELVFRYFKRFEQASGGITEFTSQFEVRR